MTVISPSSETPDVIYSPPPPAPLEVIYQDEALLVVDKPAGLLSVPGRGDGRQDCLASRAQQVVPDALIVHRLDMATSGLLVLARGAAMQRHVSQLFHDRQIHKQYEAVLHGLMPEDEGEVDLPLVTDWPRRPKQMVCHERGKPSRTLFKVLARDAAQDQTRVALEPITGRSHQLRVHMLALGHPIVGDPLYGDAMVQQRFARLMLHASKLAMPHPLTGQWLTLERAAPF